MIHELLSTGTRPPAKQIRTPCRIGLPASMWSNLNEDVRKHCWHAITRLIRAGFECVDLDDSAVADLNRIGTFTIPVYEFFMDFPRTLLSFGWANRINAIFDNIRDEAVRNIVHSNLSAQLISAADYSFAIQNVGLLRQQMKNLFTTQGVDFLAYPTVPCSVPHCSDAGRPELFSEVIRNTDLASNAAMPSVTLPVAPDGALPVGLSLDAPRGQDRRLLTMATSVEDVLNSS